MGQESTPGLCPLPVCVCVCVGILLEGPLSSRTSYADECDTRLAFWISRWAHLEMEKVKRRGKEKEKAIDRERERVKRRGKEKEKAIDRKGERERKGEGKRKRKQ
jgi:hypothetical protein